jgi:hypothetical protein
MIYVSRSRVMSIGGLLAWLLVAFTIASSVCESSPSPTHDYIFSVTGVVNTEDGMPLQDAEITLEAKEPVYKGVELIKTAKYMTDKTGGFVFMYISHRRGVNYTLTVRKEGFEPLTVSGSAPPAGNHVIRLKKIAGRELQTDCDE